MNAAVWLATGFGLAGGALLAYVVAKPVLLKVIALSADVVLTVRLVVGGMVVAILPALLLAIVVGGTLGGAWGEQLFGLIGFPMSGVPIGLAGGIGLVFALVVLCGGAIGLLIAHGVVYLRRRQARRES